MAKKTEKKLKKKIAKLKKAVKKRDQVTPASSKAEAKVSPLAPAGGTPALPVIRGARFASGEAGVRYNGRTDVMLVALDPETVIAGTFTRSATRSAPVLDCEAKIGSAADGGAAIIVNAGNSNAFTGAEGVRAVEAVTAAVASTLDVPTDRVYSSSTGVIGEPLPFERITNKLTELAASLKEDGLAAAAKAIMTTDTFPKAATATVEIDGEIVSIAGIAKGSGMIAPDMATMLVYIFTDAKISQDRLQQIVSRQTDATFNCITVDGDTSTSDTLLVAATGQSSAAEITNMRNKGAKAFEAAMGQVMLDLAQQVVRDGEGATKFVEVSVQGADSDSDARKVAMSIANSPLVKTAVAGEDPNWGRVVMAVGKSGAKADRDRLSIRFGDLVVAENGWVSPSYSEADAAAYMKRQEIAITVDLGIGKGKSTVWTCDLTHRYIDINADYRS